MAKIIEINGDLFESKAQALVNTVNCYGVMGKGIALEFKKKFPEMFEVYKEYCDKKLIKPGVLQLYKKSSPWILNFPTKDHWRSPSKLEYIESGLIKFSNEYKSKGIKSIAFPKLGTQNGGLDWEDVKILMYNYLSELEDLEVEIYHYLPVSKIRKINYNEELINAEEQLVFSDKKNRFN